jgi:oleandomycin transport system permease protein
VSRAAIVVTGLTKSFGRIRVLDGVGFEAAEGTVLALLGPNGAGKTTAVRILCTLLRPDAGHAEVLGHDVVREPQQVRSAIGLTGQYAAVDEMLSGRENLSMIGRLLGLSRQAARRRADELLAAFDLERSAGKTVKTYSGGMRRRLDLAASLVGKPLVLFLDEPTTGLDPAIQPLMFLLLFVYFFGGAIAGSSRAYIQFVLPGLVVQGVTFWSLQTAVGLNADFQHGLVDRFRSLPIARSSVVAGRIMADVLRTGWGTVITVAAGMAFGFRLHTSVTGALGAFGLILAWGFALSWLMAFLGVSLRSAETVQTAGFLLVMPLGFASSIFAAAATMPGWLQAFVKVNPVTVVADTARGLMVGGPVAGPLLKSALWLAGLTAVSWILTLRRYQSVR